MAKGRAVRDALEHWSFLFWHNVKGHAPDSLGGASGQSENISKPDSPTEAAGGGLCESACSPSSFKSSDAIELDENGESQPYRVIKNETLYEVKNLRDKADMLEEALKLMPKNKSRTYYYYVHGKIA